MSERPDYTTVLTTFSLKTFNLVYVIPLERHFLYSGKIVDIMRRRDVPPTLKPPHSEKSTRNEGDSVKGRAQGPRDKGHEDLLSLTL